MSARQQKQSAKGKILDAALMVIRRRRAKRESGVEMTPRFEETTPAREPSPDQAFDESELAERNLLARVVHSLQDGEIPVGAAVEPFGRAHDAARSFPRRRWNSSWNGRRAQPGSIFSAAM